MFRTSDMLVPPDGRLAPWHWACLALVAALMFGVEIGAPALTDHEIIVGGIAKQMARDHTWLRLYIGDVEWLEKPPLPHLLAGVAAYLFRADVAAGHGEWVVRLPSALCAAGVLAIVAGLAARLFGSALGFAAGLIFATFYAIQR